MALLSFIVSVVASGLDEIELDGQFFGNGYDSPMMGTYPQTGTTMGNLTGGMEYNPAYAMAMNNGMNTGMNSAMNTGMNSAMNTTMNMNNAMGMNGSLNLNNNMNMPQMTGGLPNMSIPSMNQLQLGGINSLGSAQTSGSNFDSDLASSSSASSHNVGSTYSNESAWDRGYDNTESSTYDMGQYNQNGNESSIHSNDAYNTSFNQFRRLENRQLTKKDDEDVVPTDPFESIFNGTFSEDFEMTNLDDEVIDGQGLKLSQKQALMNTPIGYNDPYYQSPGSAVYYNAPMPASSSFLNNGTNGSTMNQGQYGSTSNQGYVNTGSTYSNQTGWDKGYNNTTSNSYSSGASNAKNVKSNEASTGTIGSVASNIISSIFGGLGRM